MGKLNFPNLWNNDSVNWWCVLSETQKYNTQFGSAVKNIINLYNFLKLKRDKQKLMQLCKRLLQLKAKETNPEKVIFFFFHKDQYVFLMQQFTPFKALYKQNYRMLKRKREN